jgi:hypothetical protein
MGEWSYSFMYFYPEPLDEGISHIFFHNSVGKTIPQLPAISILTSPPTMQVQTLPRYFMPYFSLLPQHSYNHCPLVAILLIASRSFFHNVVVTTAPLLFDILFLPQSYNVNATTATLLFAAFVLTSPQAKSRGQL